MCRTRCPECDRRAALDSIGEFARQLGYSDKVVEVFRKYDDLVCTCLEAMAVYCPALKSIFYAYDKIKRYADRVAEAAREVAEARLRDLLGTSLDLDLDDEAFLGYHISLRDFARELVKLGVVGHEHAHVRGFGEAEATAYEIWLMSRVARLYIYTPIRPAARIWILEELELPLPTSTLRLLMFADSLIFAVAASVIGIPGYGDFVKYLRVRRSVYPSSAPFLGIEWVNHHDHIHLTDFGGPKLANELNGVIGAEMDPVPEFWVPCNCPSV